MRSHSLSSTTPAARAEIVVDLDALRPNVRVLKEHGEGRALMVVVMSGVYYPPPTK